MPDASTFYLFVLASVVVLLIPGPAVIYIVTRSIDQGRKAGIVSALGAAAGNSVHVLAAAFGLSALLASSAIAFSVVKYVGAAYLIYLGIKRLLTKEELKEGEPRRAPLTKIFRQAVVICILNPKVALFFLAFFPQFLDPAASHPTLQLLGMGFTFVGLGVLTDSTYAIAAGSLGSLIRGKKRTAQVQRYVAGGTYVALGVASAAVGGKSS